MRLYAIGDIHGHLDQLQAAHALVQRDGGANAQIVHVGDLIDRGPDSKGVISYLLNAQEQGRNWTVLLGNHDRFLIKFLADPEWIDPGLGTPLHWTVHHNLGAADTLRSYGIDPDQPLAQLETQARRAIPVEHQTFMQSLLPYFLHPQGLFVHAGVRPGVDLQDQTEQDLVWIRKDFLDYPDSFGPLVVHGHTAISAPTHYGNRVNIDSGAAYGGPLTTIVLEKDQIHLLTDQGRIPLKPEIS